MNNIINESYEQRKNDLTYEINFIEGVQYNFKLSDIQNLLEIKSREDLEIFKRFLYYLDVFRVNFLCTDSIEDELEKFKSIMQEDEKEKDKLLDMYIKHENLFCDENGVRRLYLVPEVYNSRIFKGI